MNHLLVSLRAYLDSQDCLYEFDAGQQTLHFGMEGENVRWRCLACVREPSTLAFVSLVPLRAAPPRRGACAELCARINRQLALGHFDLDFADGELRYATLAPAPEGSGMPEEVLRHIVAAHRTLMDDFVPLFARVLFAGVPPEEALAREAEEKGARLPRFSLN